KPREVVGVTPEIDVRNEQQRSDERACVAEEIGWQQQKQGNCGRNHEHREHRGEDASDSTIIEAHDRETAVADLAPENRGNQITGDHEEDIDTEEATGKEAASEVETDDRQYRYRPQTVDVGSVGLRNRRARGGTLSGVCSRAHNPTTKRQLPLG